MKKLLLISMLFLTANLFGQSIIDEPNAIKILTPKDTIVISKENIVAVFPTVSSVFILTNNIENVRLVHGYIELQRLSYSNQFSTVAKMFDFIEKSRNRDYIKTAHYTSGNPDTITYKINTTTVYRTIHTWSGTTWTGSKNLIP